MSDSKTVRAEIVEAFRRDLVGPFPTPRDPERDADLAEERLDRTSPSRWYLTGFIAPSVDAEQAEEDPEDLEQLLNDPSCQEEIYNDVVTGNGQDEEGGVRDVPAARRFMPTSIGLTAALPRRARQITVTVDWGDYLVEPPPEAEVLEGEAVARAPYHWYRKPRHSEISLEIREGSRSLPLPDSEGLQRRGGALDLRLLCRPTRKRRPDGSDALIWAVSVFLTNRRTATHNRQFADLSYAFQVRITLSAETGFEANHDLTGLGEVESDLSINDLHYRDVAFYGVGHNTASDFLPEPDGHVRRIWTEHLPQAEVERVAPNEAIRPDFPMAELAQAAAAGPEQLSNRLAHFPKLYADWIEEQRQTLEQAALVPARHQTAERLIADQERACARISDGIKLLAQSERARLAFQAMNEAMDMAARRRLKTGEAPKWRPFQLAFILLSLPGLTDKQHDDREIVDLLFFPTGGGKTEAYLGLAAYTIALRRLSAGGILGAGLSVIMRYTLRLLTLDQLSRAAALICALELLRKSKAWQDERGRPRLGDWPIEIGLWIGSAASPNKLGGMRNTGDDTAVTRVARYKGEKSDAPAPLKSCPWCQTDFTPESFTLTPSKQAPRRMALVCRNVDCAFSQEDPLPILTVDEEIYQRLPAFLIATIDKFASLPWVGETGALFGHVTHCDREHQIFYGAAGQGGQRLHNEMELEPPDLIIQDELHLISGPLGTVAGLYETVIDTLASRRHGDRLLRPKIVASTATVRRAAAQIHALFDRPETALFPPPGISRDDSFFARTKASSEDPARLYLGIAALGRGPKLVFLRALTTLVAAATAAYERNAGAEPNPADPYMTALCYFNALRELGGARRIVEDEVRQRATHYGAKRRRSNPPDRPFADRGLGALVELTSRISTDEVAAAKRRLDTPYGKDQACDVALATNMISVGLDITRLGIMLVQGQPKTAAEYIQATSRVGRDHERPGLVLAVLNVHKPRDRAHYEQFGQFHASFYRAVEATSVTPWAARALDRALAGIVVALARHLDEDMTEETAAATLADHPDLRAAVIERIAARAGRHLGAKAEASLRANVESLLADWIAIADEMTANGNAFVYADRRRGRRLLYRPLDPALGNLTPGQQRFTAAHSMRDVEPSVALRVRDPWDKEIKGASDLT